MKSSLILDIIRTHFEGTDKDFHDAVERLAVDEDRKGNSALALEIRKAARGMRSTYHEERSRIARTQSVIDPISDEASFMTVFRPNTSLDDLILEPSMSTRIREVLDEWTYQDRLPANLNPTNTVLLTGPPGCGKTMTAKAIASELGKSMAYVRLDALISQYMGQTGSNIRKAFESVHGKGMVLFIDEFDAVAKSRGDPEDVGESKRILAALLQNLDLMDEETLLIAATNMPETLDPAVTRRFKIIIRFAMPDRSSRERFIETLVARYGLDNEYDQESFVELTDGLSFADIETVVESIVRYVCINETHGKLDGTFLRSFIVTSETADIWDMRKSGMTLTQISKRTGIPVSTLSYRFRKGKR